MFSGPQRLAGPDLISLVKTSQSSRPKRLFKSQLRSKDGGKSNIPVLQCQDCLDRAQRWKLTLITLIIRITLTTLTFWGLLVSIQ